MFLRRRTLLILFCFVGASSILLLLGFYSQHLPNLWKRHICSPVGLGTSRLLYPAESSSRAESSFHPEVDYVHAGWQAQIHRELAYWDTDISEAVFLLFEHQAMEANFFGSRVVVLDNQVHFNILASKPNPHAGHTLGYTLATLLAIKQMIVFSVTNNWTLPPNGIALHIQYGDGCTDTKDPIIPIFGYNNAPAWHQSTLLERCRHTVSFPSYDWYWPGQDFLPGSPSRMDQASATRWSDKTEVLLFRGNLNSWDNMRTAVLLTSLQQPDILDAKLTALYPHTCDQIKQFEPHTTLNISETCSEFVGEHMSPSDFARQKYWLDIDGHGATFRYKNYLHGESVIFKIESEYYQHFHSGLQPWVHFIPISRDDVMTSIKERVIWAREHDEECKSMVKRTKAWAKLFLNHEQTAWYQREVLKQLSSRYNFTPSTNGLETVCCSDFDKARQMKLWGEAGYSCVDAEPCTSTLTEKKLKSLKEL
jgi:hypothetical protein